MRPSEAEAYRSQDRAAWQCLVRLRLRFFDFLSRMKDSTFTQSVFVDENEEDTTILHEVFQVVVKIFRFFFSCFLPPSDHFKGIREHIVMSDDFEDGELKVACLTTHT